MDCTVRFPPPLVLKLTGGAPLEELRMMVALPLLVSEKMRSLPELALMNKPPVPDWMVALLPSGPSIVSDDPEGDWIVMLPPPTFSISSPAPRTNNDVV